jgi:hypothetical protein
MRYNPQSIAALHIAAGRLPSKMLVDVDKGVEVSAKTVGELRNDGVAQELGGSNTQERIPKARSR